jgi:hypothetical protein
MADQHKVTDELEMEDEYDFSKGERGKFYRQDAVFLIPVWLDPDVISHFMARAKLEGVETTELLNSILRRQIGPAAGAGPR